MLLLGGTIVIDSFVVNYPPKSPISQLNQCAFQGVKSMSDMHNLKHNLLQIRSPLPPYCLIR